MSTGNGTNQLARVDAIESRIDRAAVSTIGVSSHKGMAVETMGQAMEVAKLMAVSGFAVPPHLRGNPGACLAVAVQGWEWSINPFAIANKSYVVNDRLGYESALYQAVLTRRAPINGRLKVSYEGDGQSRTCRVSAELRDGTGDVEYVSPKFGNINPKNSPLWKNDPDQQLFYFSVRAFARRHFADVMMGIATVDELNDLQTAAEASPPQSRTAGLVSKITARPVSENATFVPDPEAEHNVAAQEACMAEIDEAGDALDEQAPHAEPEPPPAAEARSPGNVSAGYSVSTWQDAYEAMEAAAQQAELSPENLGKRVGAWLLVKGLKGKADKTSLEDRVALVEAIRGGKLDDSGRIVIT